MENGKQTRRGGRPNLRGAQAEESVKPALRRCLRAYKKLCLANEGW